MSRFTLAVIWLTLASPTFANSAEPQLQDFSHRFTLQASGDNGVVALTLPKEVYVASRMPELADLRVLRADGRALPFHLRIPPAREDVSRTSRDTILFPIWVEPGQPASESLRLTLSTATDGSLSWTHAPPAVKPESMRLSALIIDTGPPLEAQQLRRLQFSEPLDPVGNQPMDYRATVAVSRSDDLQQWDLVAQQTLSWLSSSQGEARLRDDEIELGSGSGRYLKLEWRDGEALLFDAIQAQWQQRSSIEAAMLALELQPSPGYFTGDYRYRSSPALRATAVSVALAESNTVLPIEFGSYRRSRQGEWLFRSQVRGTFYRLLRDGVERASGQVRIPAWSSEEWVLRLGDPQAHPPILRLHWQPHQLVFVIQGQQAVLAVGADPDQVRGWRSAPGSLEQVAPGYSPEEIDNLERATLQVDNEPAVPPPQPTAQPGPDRRLLLWAVLAIGVLTLALISWALFRQLNSDDEASTR